jgi:DNA-binding FadR family transcriptional regulator
MFGTLEQFSPVTAEIQRSSVPQLVFRRLCRDVLSGRYAPGERLPPQRELARELGVNMASVREGIKQLEQLGLVEVRHGDAMRVRDWRAAGLGVLVHAIQRDDGLDPSLMRAVFEARRLLLAEAARLAAERRTDEQAGLLESLARQVGGAASDQEAQGLDFAFFATLVEAAGNLVLVLIMNSIRDLYFARLEAFRPIVGGRGELAPLYRRAARAVKAREGGRAAAAVTRLARLQEARMLESAR